MGRMRWILAAFLVVAAVVNALVVHGLGFNPLEELARNLASGTLKETDAYTCLYLGVPAVWSCVGVLFFLTPKTKFNGPPV